MRVVEVVVRVEDRHHALVGQALDVVEDRLALAHEGHRVDDDHALVGDEDRDVPSDAAQHPEVGTDLLDDEVVHAPPHDGRERDQHDEQRQPHAFHQPHHRASGI